MSSRIFISALLILLCASPSAHAAQRMLVVFGDENTPPYEIIKHGQAPSGFHIELIQAVAQQLKIDVEFKALPWPRALSYMQTGEADAISFASVTPQRSAYIDFHPDNVLSQSISYFIYAENNPKKIPFTGDLQSLSPYRIGTQQDYIYGQPFDNATYLHKQAVQSAPQLASMLKKRRIDLAIITWDSFQVHKQLPIFKRIQLIKPAVAAVNNYIGFSKKAPHPDLGQRFAQQMRKFKQTAQFAQLRNKYQIPAFQDFVLAKP